MKAAAPIDRRAGPLLLCLAFLLAPAGALHAQQGGEQHIRAEQLFVRGMTEAYLGDHDNAIQLFQQALPLAPQDAAIHAALAESYEATQRLSSAITYAEQAIQLAPDRSAYYFQLSNLFMLAGNPEDAEKTLRRLLDVDPANIDALYELAYIQQTAGEAEQALATYARLEERTGPSMSIKYRQLQLYRKLGDDEAVERTVRAMIDLDPSDVTMYRILGETYVAQGRSEEARAVYEQALKIEPTNFSIVFALVEAYRAAGQTARADSLLDRSLAVETGSAEQRLAQARYLYNESRRDSSLIGPALDLLGRIVQRDPPNEEAFLMLGELQIAAGSFQAAGASIYQALTINPRSPIQWNRAAWAYLQGGTPEEAARVADEALILFPGDAELLRIAGLAWLELYKNDEAIDRLEQALALMPATAGTAEQTSDILAALGLLHERKGDLAASDAFYERALEADPNNALALNNFAFSLASRGEQLKKARRYAEQAVATSPGNPSFLDTLAWVHYAAGDYQKALSVLEDALSLRGAGAAVHEHLGDVLMKLGRQAEARAAWEKALQMAPGTATLESKLGR
ncbi:MAG: tetratricopeptide repeat protein [Rhodothermales bacterium]